jgi:hypothetical protein
MKVLRYVATLFINFFSITQPQPGSENRTALYIAAMLLAVATFVAVVVTLAVHLLRH